MTCSSMWFGRQNRRRVRAYGCHLVAPGIARAPTDARATAIQLLERQLERGGLRETLPSGRRADLEPERARLLALVERAADPYVLLDAAVGLAILGEAAAIPTLRRVFDQRWFALTASRDEQGLAALGLALLGDVASIDRIRRGSTANFAGIAKPIALAVIEAPVREGREPEWPAM